MCKWRGGLFLGAGKREVAFAHGSLHDGLVLVHDHQELFLSDGQFVATGSPARLACTWAASSATVNQVRSISGKLDFSWILLKSDAPDIFVGQLEAS